MRTWKKFNGNHNDNDNNINNNNNNNLYKDYFNNYNDHMRFIRRTCEKRGKAQAS